MGWNGGTLFSQTNADGECFDVSILFYVLAQAQKIMINRWIAEAPHLWTNPIIPCVWACKDHLLEKVHKLACPMVLDRKTPKTIGNT